MKPTSASWRVAGRDCAVFLTVVVLLGVIFAYRAALEDRDDRLVANGEPLLRLQVVDRLIGLALPPLQVIGADGVQVEVGTLVSGGGAWILAPEDCTGCLDEIDSWNLASVVDEAKVSLILTGVSLEEGRRLASRAGVRVPFAVDEDNVMRRVLGLPLPSTYLAVASDRTIVMADAGSEKMSCRSGFPSRLKYITDMVLAEAPSTTKGSSK